MSRSQLQDNEECKYRSQSDRNVSKQIKNKISKFQEQNFKAVFLDMGVIEPDTTSLLLLKAGDVERSPGPSSISPEDEVCEIFSQG